MFRATKRFLRMSLWTWLVIFSIFCLLAFAYARFIRPSQLEANAIQGLEDLGIEIPLLLYEHEVEAFNANLERTASPGPDWVKAIFGEMVLAKIERVDLKGEFETLNGCLDLLKQLTHLKSLKVESSVLENVDALKQLNGLEEVTLLCHSSRNLKNIDALSSTNLSRITIWGCNGLTSLEPLGRTISLEELTISGCSEIKEVNLSGWATAKLEYIYFSDCDRLVTVNGFGLTSERCSLYLIDCGALEEITILPGGLEHLDIDRCDSLRKIKGRKSPKLKYIYITDCNDLVSIDVSLESAEIFSLFECDGVRSLNLSQPAPMLKQVYVNCCSSLISISGLPESVEELVMTECESLVRVSPQDTLPNLKMLNLMGCPNLSEAPKIPAQGVNEENLSR